MAASIVKSIIASGIIALSALTPALAATTVNGGVIHFRGAIVEDPCVISPQHNQFALSCPHEGRVQTTQVSYGEALRGRNPYPDVATVSMKYINPEKTLAVVQVNYR
ncbi:MULTISPECIES: type 1 fimbrial protein [Lelliottia]|jgi:type 1 fimbria pilin|uniref:Type 1 fimbrial protein n=1 Tax=Lelliottia wanjuensis TaxID=3050585 RepID=A0AAP4D435_9ENTR|nr:MULTISPECIES: type 1 fimbrial protein [unclassified Lelliottia]MDI3362441.1 type 1 fimbrial protein [Lelliottia sp. V89_13]MDK9363810.1 type 1 fimbrial protein [Lelliottia sp. V106_12]MDK9548791.1 type 1 fimbrial protein [Lelliottia sp. V89_5]MDK9587423.1 type 1 fimbrial protein [Lelliottia sp. V86_10]MDK9597053.1 type 1 fimbrial protein [Lelliottia sp. V89_10]